MLTPENLSTFVAATPAPAPTEPAKAKSRRGINRSPEKLREYLEQRGVQVAEVKSGAGGMSVLVLDGCPMNPDHGHDSDTAVVLRPDGVIGFECKHNSCANFKWRDVREQIDPEAEEHKQTQSAVLVEVASDAELFHWGDKAYVRLKVQDHWETHALTSRHFKTWLVAQAYERLGKPPGAQAVQDAIGVLTGMALFKCPERPVFVRIAEYDGVYWLDLADDQWRAVRIDTNGWQVVDNPPVRFIRPRALLALPIPVHGGHIDELRSLVNVRNEEAWALMVGWLVGAFRPRGPYPLLILNGEQGSAKTTLSRILRSLIDPNQAPVRTQPRDERDLMIAASNGWTLVFDNMSHIPQWLSDAFCRLATGGGFATRELYTDDGERIFDAMRPVILNGIDDLAYRPDILDRSIGITLAAIPEDQRRTEAELKLALEAVLPRVLGALLTATSGAMGRLPSVKLDRLPRLADFAVWAAAAEPALGLKPGAFLAAYTGNRASANELAVESSIIGEPLMAFVTDKGEWAGQAKSLLEELCKDAYSTDTVRKDRDWPKTGKKLAGELRRIAPNLRAMGIDVRQPRGTGAERRTWRFQKVAEQSAQRAERAGENNGQCAGSAERASQDSPNGQADPDSEAANEVFDGQIEADAHCARYAHCAPTSSQPLEACSEDPEWGEI